MDNKGVGKYQLSAYCKVLAAEFPFAHKLNSMARQVSADRAWAAIDLFKNKQNRQINLSAAFEDWILDILHPGSCSGLAKIKESCQQLK